MNEIFLSLATIRWQDILDICLTSYILFRFYVLFRGTNTFRVLMGIVLLWFLQRVAVYIGLIVFSWAVQGITAVAALLIIIIFRNEIRSVLQAKNLKAILWGFSQKPAYTPEELIVDSAFELARKGVGALMVIPGKEDIFDLVQRGIPWQGTVSREMIISIFWPDNPVHDGAAVIYGNHVLEVGVILPLTTRADLPSHYGTRHRAALGLAEICDALIIVVSEERGSVLAIKGSDIREIHHRNRLVSLVQEHTGTAGKDLDTHRRDHLKLALGALASFVVIIGFWLSFAKGLETLISYDVPVVYMNRDPGMQILETSTGTISLQLGGSGALIRNLRAEQIQIRVDLANAVVGQNTYTITQDIISLPPGVILKKVTPSNVDVLLDVPMQKTLPVQVDWIGKLSPGLVLSEITLTPETVEVVGGSRILHDITTVYTEKIPLENLTTSGQMTVNVALHPASLKISAKSKESISLSYTLKKRTSGQVQGSF